MPPYDIKNSVFWFASKGYNIPWTSGSLSQDQLRFASHNKPNCIRYIIAVLCYKFYQCL